MATKAIGLTRPEGRDDFISYNGIAPIDHTEQTAQAIFRKNLVQESFPYGIDAGTVLFTMPLTPKFIGDDSILKMAQSYEYYGLDNVVLHAQSTAPMGISSGGIQLCHVTDPHNSYFYTGDDVTSSNLMKNLEKCVRQQDSVLLRPRESVEFKITTPGELYTFANPIYPHDRWHSFGTIVAVMRDPPAAGDSLSFALTISGTARFARTCVAEIASDVATQLTQQTIKLYRSLQLPVRILRENPNTFTILHTGFGNRKFTVSNIQGLDPETSLVFKDSKTVITNKLGRDIFNIVSGDDETVEDLILAAFTSLRCDVRI